MDMYKPKEDNEEEGEVISGTQAAAAWDPDQDLDNFVVNDMGDDQTQTQTEPQKAPEIKAAEEPLSQPSVIQVPIQKKVQKPFQSGYTEQDENKRQYLTWNAMGAIICHEQDSEYSYEVDFADTNKYSMIRFRNAEYFKYAAIGSSGVLFTGASSEKKGGTIHFRAFKALATKLWTIELPLGESAVACCVCDNFVVVGTDRRHLRLFSIGGSQIGVLCCPGSIINITGKNDVYSVIYANDSGLSVRIFDGSKRKVIVEQKLCLSHESELVWCEITQQNVLITMDDKSVVRGLFNNWDWSWIPLLRLDDVKSNSDNENNNVIINDFTGEEEKSKYWPVEVDSDSLQLFAAKLDAGVAYPDVAVRPKLNPFSIKLPLCDVPNDKDNEIQTNQEKLIVGELFSVGDKNFNKINIKTKLILFQKFAEKGLLDSAYEIGKSIKNIKMLTKLLKLLNILNKVVWRMK
eukprot:UN06881